MECIDAACSHISSRLHWHGVGSYSSRNVETFSKELASFSSLIDYFHHSCSDVHEQKRWRGAVRCQSRAVVSRHQHLYYTEGEEEPTATTICEAVEQNMSPYIFNIIHFFCVALAADALSFCITTNIASNIYRSMKQLKSKLLCSFLAFSLYRGWGRGRGLATVQQLRV